MTKITKLLIACFFLTAAGLTADEPAVDPLAPPPIHRPVPEK